MVLKIVKLFANNMWTFVTCTEQSVGILRSKQNEYKQTQVLHILMSEAQLILGFMCRQGAECRRFEKTTTRWQAENLDGFVNNMASHGMTCVIQIVLDYLQQQLIRSGPGTSINLLCYVEELTLVMHVERTVREGPHLLLLNRLRRRTIEGEPKIYTTHIFGQMFA